ncbi:MAG TPA: dienelactone hydrolase family protein [Devosiaceae bacterium]|nr:dienelactone hydrolase family protein [Devosiaceae bacterium]
MGEFIKLTASDGFTLNAYTVAPEGKAKGAVVVIQEVWGVNHWVQDMANRVAQAGFYAVAPAIMDRIEPGYESEDYGPTGFARVGELMKSFSPDLTKLDVEAAVKEASKAGKVGITGFCLGGTTSWRAAHFGLGLSAASGYYGGGVPNYIDLAPTIPIEMHYGDKDTGIPMEQVEELRKRYPEVPVYIYNAGHGFMNNERAQASDPAAAALSWPRTLAFFEKHLA